MRVRRLTIERFRGIESFVLCPGARTVLIGPNNTGKSTILEALDLALNSGEGRPRPGPREIDYYDRNTSAGFRIEVVLGDLTTDQQADFVTALEGWRASEQLLVPEPDGPDVEAVVRLQVEGTAEMELDSTFAKDEIAGRRFGRRERRNIGWVFDGRTRDPARQLAFYQGGLLDQLFSALDLLPPVEAVREALEAGAGSFNADAGVAAELARIGEDVRELGFLEAGDPAFEAGAISKREILQTLRIGLPGPAVERIPLDRQGRGVQRLVVLAILLRLARGRRGPILIGGFEEPEEALEPIRQAQASVMLAELAASGGQVFITTHSPDIVRAFTPGDLVLLEPGRSPTPRPLAALLTPPARHGLERRVSGPLARALFSPAPAVVEGPSDKAVFDVMFDALARDGAVLPATRLGLEFVSAEGASQMPGTVQILREAGKNVVAVIERDMKQADDLLKVGACAAAVVYPDEEDRNNLERLISASFPIDALTAGMTALAADRGDDWRLQRDHLASRIGDLVPDRERRERFAAAEDLRSAMTILLDAEARALIAWALAGSGHAPFEIKGAASARIFTEALIAAAGVADPFRRALRALGEWLATPAPRAAIRIQI